MDLMMRPTALLRGWISQEGTLPVEKVTVQQIFIGEVYIKVYMYKHVQHYYSLLPAYFFVTNTVIWLVIQRSLFLIETYKSFIETYKFFIETYKSVSNGLPGLCSTF